MLIRRYIDNKQLLNPLFSTKSAPLWEVWYINDLSGMMKLSMAGFL